MTYGALHSTKMVNDGRFAEAVARASQEIATMPDEPEAYFNRGQAYAGLGRWEEAVDDYARALAMDASASAVDPAAIDDELFFALRSQAVGQKARPEEAVATIERYRTLAPEGRHLEDVAKWIAHVNGVEEVWYRDRV